MSQDHRPVLQRDRSLVCLSILLLAIIRGGLYASLLPPWGLIDEQHHVHYVQYVAEQQALPVVGETYLSPEIIESLFVTRRWETFHWRTPASSDPQELGLEGHSYEGYQPPLFYVLLAPLFAALPGDILAKLYCLRWVAVGLSLLTVWMTYLIAAEVFPQHRALPYLACFILVMIPERMAAVSRVNNDALLEVIGTAFVWVCTRAMLRGLSARRSQALGLLLGLGLLTKTSMLVLAGLLPLVFWVNRRESNLTTSAMWAGGISACLLVPLVARNVLLYGDLTGFAGFRQLNETLGAFRAVDLAGRSLLAASWDLFRHFWAIWWKGAAVGGNPVLTGLYIVLAVLTSLSVVALLTHLRRTWNGGSWGRLEQVISAYVLVIVGYALAVLVSYFDGQVPVIQGRFLLPIMAPIVILFSWGLLAAPRGKGMVLSSLGTLLALDTLSLFGNLLPYFYYWSAFAETGALYGHAPLGAQAAWGLFLERFLRDKPPAVPVILVGLLPLYIVSLATGAAVFTKRDLLKGECVKLLRHLEGERSVG